MNSIEWAKGYMRNEKSQKLLEEKVQLLLNGPLKNKDEYQQEKAIKMFAERVRFLEGELLYKNGAHPDQITKHFNPYDKEKILKAYDEVERTIDSELNRGLRFFTIFLN